MQPGPPCFFKCRDVTFNIFEMFLFPQLSLLHQSGPVVINVFTCFVCPLKSSLSSNFGSNCHETICDIIQINLDFLKVFSIFIFFSGGHSRMAT